MQESENFALPDCDVPAAAASPGESSARDEAMRAVARRLVGRVDELAWQIVARYREEIIDYRASDDSLAADAAGLALDNLEALLANLERGESLSDEQLEKTRMGAARRVHQGVSLESFLQAGRLWGQVAWETLRAAARVDCQSEREAALDMASRVMRHVDLVSTAGAHAYLHEAQGLSSSEYLLQRDLLEALLGGERDSTKVSRRARLLGVRLAENYVVIFIRPQEVSPGGTDGQPSAASATVRGMLETARTHLSPSSGALLVGLRHAEVVALYPVLEPAEVQIAKQDADSFARAVAPSGVSVGMSGWRPGLAGIASAYAEAKEAAQIAAGSGITGRVVTLDEVLIDHVGRCTPHVSRILDETLQPLVQHDLAHQSALVPTLRAYIDAGFNLTKSAEVLHVHPNTVTYRLRRIKALCGRDPHDPDDLLILLLALKLARMSPEP